MVDRHGKTVKVGDLIKYVGLNWIIKRIHESQTYEKGIYANCITTGSGYDNGNEFYLGGNPKDFELLKSKSTRSHFPNWW